MYPLIVEERLPRVQAQIAEAARRSGRDPEAVRLVAVTKGHPPEAIGALLEAGVVDIGENRVEELERKVPLFDGAGVTWHMIGHLQRRKAPRAAQLADMIHAIDSIRLAERISRAAAEMDKEVPALIQVNTSGEATKGGFPSDEALEAIGKIAELEGIRPRGLMTMAPFTSDEKIVRTTFSGLRRVLEAAAEIAGFEAIELSMGMSNDFLIAIEEGSTMVRLGTALLGERPA